MNHQLRLAFRAATLIRGQLAAAAECRWRAELPERIWQECVTLDRKLKEAEDRGWRGAARRLTLQFGRAYAAFRQRLEEVGTALDAAQTPRHIASLPDIYADVLALEDEFEEVNVRIANATLSVVTDEVVLEGVALGRFRIVLDWTWLGDSKPYQVIALEPNPASSNPQATHPHVEGDELCAGDGGAAIRGALRQGRLLDFFVLVRQVLRTYNSSSAYVSLEQWHGAECSDCGRLVDGDDQRECYRCESGTCDECATGCPSCDELFCGECVSRCPCGDFYCLGCLCPCAGCQDSYCPECLIDEKCPKCREDEEDEREKGEGTHADDDSAPGTDESGGVEAAVQPLRVGEAAVSA